MEKFYKIFLYFSLFIFHFSLLSAQQHQIDSLFAVLKTEKEDTGKAKILNMLSMRLESISQYHAADSLVKIALPLSVKLNYKNGEAYCYSNMGVISQYQGNYKEALSYMLKALELYKETGNKQYEGATYGNIGSAYMQLSNYPDALKNQLLSVQIMKELGNKRNLSDAYGNIGEIYGLEGNYPEALRYTLLASQLDEELNNKQGIAVDYSTIGNIYESEDNNPQALVYYFKALQVYRDVGNKLYEAITYGNIGDIYELEKNYPEALKFQNLYLQIAKDLGSKDGVANASMNIGRLNQAQGAYAEAMKNMNQAMQIFSEINNTYEISNAYMNIGAILTDQKKYAEAKINLEKALTLAKSIGGMEILRTGYASMAGVDSALGNYNGAFNDYKEYVVYRDSINNETNTRKLVQEQMQYDFDKKQAEEKAEQDKKDTIAAADKKRQSVIMGSVSVTLLLVLTFSVLLFSRFKVTQKQKKVIEKQKTEVEEKNKEVLDSITYAKRLQDAILPPMSLIEKYFPESFVLYRPKDIVAGDFYWMERAGDNILIAAADCTGHGVPGAMVSVVCSNALNRTVKEFKITEPGKVLDKVRELVLETFEKSEDNVQDGMDISLCSINTQTKEMQWSGAYNSLWYFRKGEVIELPADKQPIGKTDNPKSFTTHTLSLGTGSSLYLFTDGYADQFGGPKGKKFKYQQLKDTLIAISSKPMHEQKKILAETLENWKGNLEQVDDILIIGIRI